jgi:hypothetical protein
MVLCRDGSVAGHRRREEKQEEGRGNLGMAVSWGSRPRRLAGVVAEDLTELPDFSA